MLGGVTHQFVGVFLQSYGYFSIGRILEQWSQYGLFDFILPFLLIFALVFGVLSTMNLFKDNKAVNGIIALAVALMSLQFGLVPAFFAELWPRFGVGIAIYLVFLILVGFFIVFFFFFFLFFLRRFFCYFMRSSLFWHFTFRKHFSQRFLHH